MRAGEAGGESVEAHVPFRDCESWNWVAPFAGEGHAVQGGNVDNEKITGAGVV